MDELGTSRIKTRQKQSSEIDKENEKSEQQENQDYCPECQSATLATDDGEIICENCGLVLDDTQIDRGPEWRSFDEDGEQKSRVGAPTTETMHDKGLTTNIGWQNKDSNGNRLSNRRREQVNRLRKWQERIRTSDAGERNLQFALGEIDRMASALGIPEATREIASVTYRRALEDDLLRGRSIEGIASSSLYVACRQENIARSLDEITNVSRVDYIEIGRSYRYLADNLDIKLEPVDPKTYIPRYASDLELSQETIERANEIVDVSKEEGIISGKSPPAFAAAAIYGAGLLSNEECTQKEVGKATNVSQVTIRNRYKEQFEVIGIYDDIN